jgi:hypothetical protein
LKKKFEIFDWEILIILRWGNLKMLGFFENGAKLLKIVGIFEKDVKFLKKLELKKKVGNIWEF